MPNDEPGSQNPEAPKFITAEEVGNIVNQALTARFPKLVGPALDAALKPLTDKLATLSAPPPPNGGDDDSGGRKGKQSPELLAMSQKVEQMEKALKEEKERVATAEKKGRDDRAFNELRTSLEGKVRPELLDMVAKHHFHIENRVETDETGNVLFKATRIPYVGADPEEFKYPLKAGIEDWLKSDAAKPFLPAPSAGAGSQPLPKRNPPPLMSGTDFSKAPKTDAEKLARAAEKERVVREKLGLR